MRVELFDADVVTLPPQQPSWWVRLRQLEEQEREERIEYASKPNFNGKEASNFFHLTDFGCRLVTDEVCFNHKLSLIGEEDKD